MMHPKQFIPLILALAGAAQAAELGDIAPRSYIGQPLAVDIELVSLTPEEAVNLPVRLAQADVYRAANAAINPALASVRMQVEKRGQKQILHVTTTRAVEAEYLHLYVELGVPGKSEVRLATVWLQRDPNPPAPVQVAAVTPAAPPASAMTPAQAEQIAAQARAARAAAAEAAKAEAAKAELAKVEAAKAEAAKAELAKAEAARERAKPAPMPSVHEAETGKPGEIKAAGQARRIAGVLVGSDGKPVAPSAHEEANAVPIGVSQALLPLAPLPLPKGVKRPAQASCAPTGMSAKECVALDARNTEMASKITELESKLMALQGALGGAAPAARPGVPAAATSAAATTAAAVTAGQAGKGKPGAQAGATAGAASPAAQAASAAAPAAAKNGASGPGGGAAGGAANGAAGHAAPGSAAEKAGAKVASAGGATSAGDAGGKGASSALASASLSAQGETEAHAAKAAGASASASAAAAGEASASAAASVPTKQVRVLPKLKYKKEKEKPAEQSSSMLPLIGGGVGLLALLGGGFVFLRKRSAGKGPLKIWQGFRKKKTDEPRSEPVAEAAPESVA